MLKITSALCSVLIILGLMVACSNTEHHAQYDARGISVTIIDIRDEPNDAWFDPFVLAEINEHERIVFNHTHLENIGATIGNVVEITIQGDHIETDPAQVYVKKWFLIQ